MTTGARGFTVVRAPAVAAPAASAVAWELAARARFDHALAGAHDALATLAFDVAEGLLGHAVSVDAATLDALVSQALARARGSRRLLVLVHPDDVAAARRSVADALAGGADPEWVEFAADPSVARGCVAIESERGRVTADWAGSLALARARWLASLPEADR